MRCFVVGSPIAHSLSPAMHLAAYGEHGVDWQYERREVPLGQLNGFVAELADDVHGLSVTAPLKPEAAALAWASSRAVTELGVANTLTRTPGGWRAANTDVDGIVSALAEVGIEQIESVRMLGAGATATSAIYALAQLGATSIEFAVRDPQRCAAAIALAEGFGVKTALSSLSAAPARSPHKVDLLFSTVPVTASAPHAPMWATASSAVFDVVYDPWPTALMTAAQASGAVVVSGLDLLAHQAARQVELMTGLVTSPAVLREAAVRALR